MVQGRTGFWPHFASRSVDFRADLPRHDTAKLYERLLRDGYAAQAAGSSHQAQGTR